MNVGPQLECENWSAAQHSPYLDRPGAECRRTRGDTPPQPQMTIARRLKGEAMMFDSPGTGRSTRMMCETMERLRDAQVAGQSSGALALEQGTRINAEIACGKPSAPLQKAEPELRGLNSEDGWPQGAQEHQRQEEENEPPQFQLRPTTPPMTLDPQQPPQETQLEECGLECQDPQDCHQGHRRPRTIKGPRRRHRQQARYRERQRCLSHMERQLHSDHRVRRLDPTGRQSR